MGGVAIVLPGGGERLIPWETGVIAGLLDAGIDLRGASSVVGTSAGAVVGARLAAGVDAREISDRLEAREVPDEGRRLAEAASTDVFKRVREIWGAAERIEATERREAAQLALQAEPAVGEEEYVAAVARRLRMSEWPPGLRVVAIDTGSGERGVFDAGSGVPLARAVAASTSVLALFPPVSVGGHRYVDGAVGSATHADLAAEDAPDRAVVLSGADHRAERRSIPGHWLAELEREVALLEGRGVTVAVLQASAEEQDAMGSGAMDPTRAPLAAAAGRRAGRSTHAEAIRAAFGSNVAL